MVVAQRQSLLGIFPSAEAAAEALDELEQKAGITPHDFDVLTSSPYPEGAFGEKPVAHRLYIFPIAGALCGFSVGLLLTIGTQMAYPLVTHGKPVIAIPAMLIVIYEGTMLGAILFTILGILFESRLPSFGVGLYDPRISEGYVGVVVSTTSDRVPVVERVMRDAGAADVIAGPPRGG